MFSSKKPDAPLTSLRVVAALLGLLSTLPLPPPDLLNVDAPDVLFFIHVFIVPGDNFGVKNVLRGTSHSPQDIGVPPSTSDLD